MRERVSEREKEQVKQFVFYLLYCLTCKKIDGALVYLERIYRFLFFSVSNSSTFFHRSPL